MATSSFGEVFTGQNADGKPVRILVVDPELGRRAGFAAAAKAAAVELAGFEHQHVAASLGLAAAHNGKLVAVTRGGGVELAAVLADGPLPAGVGLGVGLGVIAGLAAAHERGHCHGALHPQSVVVAGGRALVTDFAVARGVIAAAAEDGGAGLLAPLRDFLAPELALGGRPSPRADVHAAGALLQRLLPGEAPGPALAELFERCARTAPGDRYPDAGALLAAARDAARRDGLEPAGPAAIASAVGADALDSETEDLLADIARQGAEAGRAVPGAGAVVGAVGLRPATAERAVDELLAELDGGTSKAADFDDDLTEVEDERRGGDQLSQVLRAAEGELAAEETPDDFDLDPTPLPPPRPFHDVTATVSLEGLDERDRRRHRRSLFWWGVIACAAASLAVIVYTQRDLFSPEARQARAEERERARAESLAEHLASQSPPGQIVVRSDTEGAAVWLLLGRTPVESFALPSSMIHELRVEKGGYLPADLHVSADSWSGEPKARRAHLSVTLEPGEAEALAPTAPPPPETMAPGGPGSGVIRVESQPSGAAVWLLVGFTPEVRVSGLPTDRGYQLRALAEGRRPATIAIRADEWQLSSAGTPGAPAVERRLEIPPPRDKHR